MAQKGYQFQEYPKWVEKDGAKFVVNDHAEYLQHFPEVEAPAETVSVDTSPTEQEPEAAPEKPRRKK